MYTVTKTKEVLKNRITHDLSRVLYKVKEFDGYYSKFYFHIEQAGINVDTISAYETNEKRAFNLYNSLGK